MSGDGNHKLRAIFLAALMFFWLFAGTMAFAGGAVAQEPGEGEAVLFDGEDHIETFDGDTPIQGAIGAVGDETDPRIEVGPGTYEESVKIDVDDLTIESAEGPGETTIEGDILPCFAA